MVNSAPPGRRRVSSARPPSTQRHAFRSAQVVASDPQKATGSPPAGGVRVAVAVVAHAGRVLIGRRPECAALAGLWEFPGGKVQPAETPTAAAARECREETGLAIAVDRPLAVVHHTYDHGPVELHFFACTPAAPADSPAPPFTWVEIARLGEYAFPAANAAVLDMLHRGGFPS